MANYYATNRSNYFRVKDKKSFFKAMAEIDGIIVNSKDGDLFSIVGDDPNWGGWPSHKFLDGEEPIEIDLPEIVAEHLEDGEVAIFIEAGAEKLRYVCGWAEAINNKKERRVVDLRDIYELAKELTTKPITRAAY